MDTRLTCKEMVSFIYEDLWTMFWVQIGIIVFLFFVIPSAKIWINNLIKKYVREDNGSG